MGPLDVAEILVVERLGQGAAVVLEGVDRAVLAVEEGPRVPDLGQGSRTSRPTLTAAATVSAGKSMVPSS
jgi:hypothetical protein